MAEENSGSGFRKVRLLSSVIIIDDDDDNYLQIILQKETATTKQLLILFCVTLPEPSRQHFHEQLQIHSFSIFYSQEMFAFDLKYTNT